MRNEGGAAVLRVERCECVFVCGVVTHLLRLGGRLSRALCSRSHLSSLLTQTHATARKNTKFSRLRSHSPRHKGAKKKKRSGSGKRYRATAMGSGYAYPLLARNIHGLLFCSTEGQTGATSLGGLACRRRALCVCGEEEGSEENEKGRGGQGSEKKMPREKKTRRRTERPLV